MATQGKEENSLLGAIRQDWQFLYVEVVGWISHYVDDSVEGISVQVWKELDVFRGPSNLEIL